MRDKAVVVLVALAMCASDSADVGQSPPRLSTTILVARALTGLRSTETAAMLAKRRLGSSEDAHAKQILGRIAVEKDPTDPMAQDLLWQALFQHFAGRDYYQAAVDVQYLLEPLTQDGRFAHALSAARLGVEAVDAIDDPLLQGNVHLMTGILYQSIGDYPNARTQLELARSLLKSDALRQTYAQLWYGTLLLENGAKTAGEEWIKSAIEGAERIHDLNVPDAARLNLAYDHSQRGNLALANSYLQQVSAASSDAPSFRYVQALILAGQGRTAEADRLLEEVSKEAPDDDYAIDIQVERGLLAERRGDLDAAEARYLKAIQVVDRLRVQSDALELRPWILSSRRRPYGLLIDLRGRRSKLTEALAVAERLQGRTCLDALVEVGDSRAGYFAWDAIGAQLRSSASARALSADELRVLLMDREVLAFVQTGVGSWRFHIVNGNVASFVKLPEKFTKLASDWKAEPSDVMLAEQLGHLLIPEVAWETSSRPLYIVASGSLSDVPFPALRANGHYLVQQRTLARLPNLASLSCRGRLTTHGRDWIGDAQGNLPAAKAEVEALAIGFGDTPRTGSQATWEWLQSHPHSDLWHIAVHAGGGSQSVLRLFDEDVTAAEILRRGIAPRLAVLAGCATAVGGDDEGWGALSMAFLAAGTRNVVATLRSVNDASASKLMRLFYAAGGLEHPVEALNAAQREMLRTSDKSIDSWAWFAVYGASDAATCARP